MDDAQSGNGMAAMASQLTGAQPQPGSADDWPQWLDRALMARRLGGDCQQLPRLLALFLGQCGQWLTSLRHVGAAAGGQSLALLAHTIKGSAGLLGLDAVRALAMELEQQAQHGGPVDDELLASLVGQLQQLTDEGQQWLAHQQLSAVPASAPLASWLAGLDELEQALQVGEFKAAELLPPLLAAAPQAPAALLAALVSATQRFDFTEALSVLVRLRQWGEQSRSR